jgi:hypothetical protein
MEVRVELDEALVDELDEEATLQGFDDREAYLRWIVAHRPMSELATTQAPAVASRVSELEERVTVLERQLDLDQPVDAESDLASSTGGGDLEPSGGGGSLDAESGSGGASLGEMDTSTDEMELDEPEPAPADEPEEEAAGDDDIADAIGDIEIEDEDEEADGTGDADDPGGEETADAGEEDDWT